MSEIRPHFEFSQGTIDERLADHWQFAEDFVEGIKNDEAHPRSNVHFVISRRRMKLAIESAYQDIARYKNYHQRDPWNEQLDCVKRCAYLIKWIVVFKPILVVGDDGADPDIDAESLDDLEILNEFFAIYLFELHLSDEIDKDVALSDGKTRELAYDLLYRQITVDGWIAVLQLIKDCCWPKLLKNIPFVGKL